MPSPLRNGDAAQPRLPSHAVPPRLHHHYPPFHTTVSEHKIRRLNLLVLLLRLAAFCFSLAAAVFTAANSNSSRSSTSSWLNFDSFRRLVFATNAIVAIYSLLEMCASIREILHGTTLLPEPMQLWFDFAHDQLFAYLALAAGAAGATAARGLSGCSAEKPAASFCVQAYISVALGLAGFGFLALSALVSGFRVASYVLTGSRFPLY
ncbi:hypothetical protein Cni_G23797 [Canna indica]|uniref:CASP-like protein n=1 Tax=Canna indica TaxID=4628 RepID=A0AAQ3QMU8_9LILI|nr:hypothetical protein Cni_G23797 [Canna indica]